MAYLLQISAIAQHYTANVLEHRDLRAATTSTSRLYAIRRNQFAYAVKDIPQTGIRNTTRRFCFPYSLKRGLTKCSVAHESGNIISICQACSYAFRLRPYASFLHQLHPPHNDSDSLVSLFRVGGPVIAQAVFPVICSAGTTKIASSACKV